MSRYGRCGNCIYFSESVGYCPIYDRDVTRYNGCYKHMTEDEYEDKLEEQEEDNGEI